MPGGVKVRWLESKRRLSGSENTVIAYGIAYRQFVEWSPVGPLAVTTQVAQEWAAYLGSDGLAPATIALKLAALSSFYEFVLRDGGEVTVGSDHHNPFDGVERPRISPYGRATFPRVEEARAILVEINRGCLTGKRDFALLYTLLVTCRRISEVLGMRWGDLEALGDGHYEFRYRGKRGKVRRAVLNRRCYAAIVEYLEMAGRDPGPDDYIWVPLDAGRIGRLPQWQGREVEANRPISASFAARILKKYANRAGVERGKAHLHGLRHTGARLRVRLMKRGAGGVDYMELRDLLGHSNLAVTQVYCERVAEDPIDPSGDAAAAVLVPEEGRGEVFGC